jgi:hypothetical protein
MMAFAVVLSLSGTLTIYRSQGFFAEEAGAGEESTALKVTGLLPIKL